MNWVKGGKRGSKKTTGGEEGGPVGKAWHEGEITSREKGREKLILRGELKVWGWGGGTPSPKRLNQGWRGKSSQSGGVERRTRKSNKGWGE